MLFWIIAAALAAFVVATLWRASLGGATALGSAERDITVYRDQLAEVERDLGRGVIGAEDAARLRIEISRRILAADRARAAGAGEGRGPRWAVPALSALAVIGVFAVYARLGAPDMPDMPMSARSAAAADLKAARPTQAEAEAAVPEQLIEPDPEFAVLMDKLRLSAEEHPDLAEGFRLLSIYEARLGKFGAAARAKARLIALTPEAEVRPDDYAELADLLIRAAGGIVTAEGEAALGATLARDPANGTARFYTGLLEFQTGRPDHAFNIWRTLLEKGPQDAPWIPYLRENIATVAALAGVDYAPPAAPPGPSAADMAAAAEMSGEDRSAMIRTMVEGLETRLAEDGGTPAEWARLIGALGVLGEGDRAKAAYQSALAANAGNAAALAEIDDAAARAGLSQ
ncbi:c-type cytochrome biogenesis protein CcmI [Defluviimonas sp. WL0075]|uniref:C-type cytochrome biogenesis protein CcmI n=1 Tax=Albidovulum sediminicola TaxID=2984331 RepID=A0ABT2Z640_9RHOB|nr:c-type cytochrome biogenesis protein CcmI [Defluviimonas sp. WL0075]MCV2866531.1 c-type cytochrome biogenesis protein CcmI [Defluviimonas sp. WL0075]